MKCWLTAACLLVILTGPPVLAMQVAPEPGMLLVARSELADPRFRDAVILLVQHGPGGTAGLILNRPSRLPLAEVFPEPPAAASAWEGTLAYGGPVAPRAFIVLVRVQGEPPEPSRKVAEDVYLTGSEQFLDWLGKNRATAYRVFAGYGGWAPGQLAEEMTRGDWRVLPVDERMLFAADATALWQLLSGK